MRRLPRTLYGQLLLTLLTSVLLANVIGIALVLTDREQLTRTLRAEYVAQHLADMINLLDETPPANRGKLAGAMSSPLVQVVLGHPWLDSRKADWPEASMLCQLIRDDLNFPYRMQVLSFREDEPNAPEGLLTPFMEPGMHVFSPADKQFGVKAVPSDMEAGEQELKIQMATVQVTLRDGTVATFRIGQVVSPKETPWRVTAWLLLVALVVAAVSAWAVRRLTRPLALFSKAASGLAANLDQPALPETGTQEVVNATRAFNRMQKELQRFLQTRSQMLAGVSHDLRLPITRIRLRLEQLQESPQRQAIERDLVEMDQLIGDTLAYLRLGQGNESRVLLNLDALLEGAIEDIEALGAQVRYASEPVKPLLARPQALRRCIANLLENARRYGGDGVIEVRLLERDGRVEVLVRDHGPGIADADLERVFEPYVRLEHSRAKHTGGSGLGLAIARAIAREHDGDILLFNHPQGGLCAELNFPAQRAA
ncbi:ATP-binding protein [Chromobacterium alticapitis]|uniref:histidine kinase n=1 Tax=Chromobacterium alticapitis TaxID=2073169 RepID=A0A2S5DBP3_9NEIS|nr:ATP-binding protein [Chromobacterium alticapitis]POZ60506.1 sensor protein [Chromobacterium alticapitis]